MSFSPPGKHPTHIEVDAPNPGDGQTVSAADARSGQKTGYMRWVLIISTVLAVVVLIAVFSGMVGKTDRGGLGAKGVSAPAAASPT